MGPVGQGLALGGDYLGHAEGKPVSVLNGCNLTRVVAAWGLGNIPVHAAVAVQTPSMA